MFYWMLLEQLDIFTSCELTLLISIMLFCLTAELLHVVCIDHICALTLYMSVHVSVQVSVLMLHTAVFIILFQMPIIMEVVCSLHVYMYIQNKLDIPMVHLHI